MRLRNTYRMDLARTLPINDWPEADRPREKLLQRGAESLSDADKEAPMAELPGELEDLIGRGAGTLSGVGVTKR